MRQNIKAFLDNNKWIKGVPNTLTVCNSICGFAAIVVALQAFSMNPDDALSIGAILIMCAMIFDALDGFAARILNAASLKGIQMDSLADMVTFGVSPAVLVTVLANVYASTTFGYWVAWICSALYIACAAHRLAKYNVQTMVEKKSSNTFYGLPSPAAAAAVCSIIFLFSEYDNAAFLVKVLPFYAGFMGLLMVSKVRYTHMFKWLVNIKRNKRRLLVIAAFIVLLFVRIDITIAAVINAYVIIPFIWYNIRLSNIRRRAKRLKQLF